MLRGVLSLLVLAIVAQVGARRVGPLPPLGALLDPVNGIWAVASVADPPPEAAISLPGLSDPVEALIDDRGVPHIFGGNEEDVARALGYLVARDRLFQLELRWRTTAGRLSELAGERTAEFDRYMRGLGLARSAEITYGLQDPEGRPRRMMEAYAEGVNAYIDGMRKRDVPFEFYLLGTRPARFEPVYGMYLVKLMGWDLTYGVTTDLRRLRARARVGEEATDALFPRNSPIQQPIQPNGQRDARYRFATIPPPGEPDLTASRLARGIELALGPFAPALEHDGERERIGSNNWAVSASRTASGYALLSGDPHLGLSLPSTWYEVHLVVEGSLDVYGVTFPSLPMPAIGFNRDVAWSFTNTGADVIDYYEEELDDPAKPTRYRVNGEWRPLDVRVEEIRGRGGKLLMSDTVYFTHRGPLIDADGRRLSMRWMVLEGTNAAAPMTSIAYATSVDEWLEALAPYDAPAQNGIVADRSGSIAIRSTGKYPIHVSGAGTQIRDGRTTEDDWAGFWPIERYPFARDPEQGYLASANQQPIDPDIDPTYLAADWPTPWRAIRINQLLASNESVTAEAMRRYHTDPGNARADYFVPYFLEAVERLKESEAASGDDAAIVAGGLLAEWDRLYTKENERAVLFEAAMTQLSQRAWDELRIEIEDVEPSPIPSSAVLASLLAQPDNLWWDDVATVEREGRDAILIASLAAGYEDAKAEHGEPDSGGWRWSRVRHARIDHILGLEPLSIRGTAVQGGPGALNPSSGRGTHGASWRMVVELAPAVRAWTIYPGGQSGNPVSARYADRVEKWANGDLEEALFPEAASELDPSRILARVTFSRSGR